MLLAGLSVMLQSDPPGGSPVHAPTDEGDGGDSDDQAICPLFEVVEVPEDDWYIGVEINNLGDKDGDGAHDIVVMNVTKWGGTNGVTSSIYTHYGPKNHIIAGSKDRDLERGVRSISDVSWSTPLGDVNGDGYTDMASTEYPSNHTNINWYVKGRPIRLQVRYGSSAGLLLREDSMLAIEPVHTQLADWDLISYAGVGDVNGDGFDDLLVVATKLKQSIVATYIPQEVQLVYGSSEGLGFVRGWSAKTPPEASHHWAAIITIAHGDFDGDGHSDIVIGRRVVSDVVFPGEGRIPFISVFHGSSHGLEVDEPDLTYSKDVKEGDVLDNHFVCELNDDGHTDLLTVCRGWSSPQDTYYLEAFEGTSRGLGEEPSDVHNVSLWERVPVLMADIDGDGMDDIVHVRSKRRYPDVWPAIYPYVPASRLDITVNVYKNTGRGFEESPSIGGMIRGILGDSITAMEVSDMDGDGMADIVLGLSGTFSRMGSQTRKHPGRVVVVFGAGLVQASQPLDLVGGPRLYAGYRDYHFVVRDTPAAEKPSAAIRLTLDPEGANVTFAWKRREGARDVFERSDSPYAELLSLPEDVTYDPETGEATVDFKVYIEWSWPHERPCDAVMEFIDPDGLVRVVRKEAAFSVENDLDFAGDLRMTGEVQGDLDEGDWVAGGELVSAGGVTVVYQGTTDVHPPAGVANVVIIDDEEDFASAPNGPDGAVDTAIEADTATDLDERYLLTLQDLPGTARVARHLTFRVRVDADRPRFKDPMPDHDDWISSNHVLVGITADDTGTSGVDGSTLEYSLRGSMGFGTWSRTRVRTTPDGPVVHGMSRLDLPDGDRYHVRWRVRDLAGNDWAVSDEYRIRIDTNNVTFTDPVPPEDVWHNTSRLQAGITVRDLQGSGIDVTTIRYRISPRNLSEYGPWHRYEGQHTDSQTIVARVFAVFGEGPYNLIQWRAADIAGNGLTVSGHFRVLVDTTPIRFHGFEPRGIQGGPEANASVVANDTYEGVGVDHTTLRYRTRSGGGEWSGWMPARTAPVIDWSSGEPVASMSPACLAIAALSGLEEGGRNHVQFSGLDLLGNGPAVSEEYRLVVDTEGPWFVSITPPPGEVQRHPEVTVNITLWDAISGVDMTRVYFRHGTDGEGSLGEWGRMPVERVEAKHHGAVSVALARGRDNYVQFKCYDMLGNENVSRPIQVWVNRMPQAVITEPREGEEVPAYPSVLLSARGSVDPDDDRLSFAWHVDGSSQPVALGREAELDLSRGDHVVTLVVTDGHGGEDSVTVGFEVVSASRDSLSATTSLLLVLVAVMAAVTAYLWVRQRRGGDVIEPARDVNPLAPGKGGGAD